MRQKSYCIFRKLIFILIDILAVGLAAFLANGDFLDLQIKSPFFVWVGANSVLLIALFFVFGLYNIVLSSWSWTEFIKQILAIGVYFLCNLIFVLVTRQTIVSISGLFGFTSLLLCLTAFTRCAKRLCIYAKYFFSAKKGTLRVMIIGGGEAGSALIKEMQFSTRIHYKPVCVIDDDAHKRGRSIHGVKIIGGSEHILDAYKKYSVQEIFITIPSAPKKRISEIVSICQECGCPIKTLPGIYQLALGQVAVSSLREVDVQDLLGREQVEINLEEIIGYIQDKVVLVTGGGGSIGSELCRQIASHKPKTLIILDIYENNAYDIEQELLRKHKDLPLIILIASVRDKAKMRDVFEKYRPNIVFHAAAHKHVPLMETSPNEAVKNNVFGTLNVAKCADEFEVETFVQISTDKAVNPTNIMGATKRICEMLIQTIGRHSKKTKFVAVRFGNVLGSNGSVIPLFKKQIADGGPVTVTHRDIIRYFMTIPEAVSLVLQAGAYAQSGQIFVLDMGEPVRIDDLAHNLIRMSGYEPNVDIKIEYTGLRPGEKLFEERLMAEEGLQKTPNGLINIAKPIDFNETVFWETLEKLSVAVNEETYEMRYLVKELVPTYTVERRDIKELLNTCYKEEIHLRAE